MDIGTGTGKLLLDLARLFPSAEFHGLDLAYGMISRAYRVARECAFFAPSNGTKFPLFLQADAEKLPYRSEVFDLVLSNLAYQWVPDLGQAFREAYRILKPGGRFFFSTFGHGTLAELHTSFREAHRKLGEDLPRKAYRKSEEDAHREAHQKLEEDAHREAHQKLEEDTHRGAHQKLEEDTHRGAHQKLEEDTHRGAHQKLEEDTQQSHGQPFLTPKEIDTALKGSGFPGILVREYTMSRAYPDVQSLLFELKATGASNATLSRSIGLGRRRVLEEMSNYYEQHFQNGQGIKGIMATYQVILAQGEKR